MTTLRESERMAELNTCNSVSSTETQSETLFEDAEKINQQSEIFQQVVESENHIVKVPRANSKLILQNMEEVLNSVKKKHRQKHRRKKEQKKLAMLAELAQAKSPTVKEKNALEIEELNKPNDGSGSSDNSAIASQSKTSENNYKKKCTKKPLQEQQIVQENKRSKSKRHKAVASPIKNINCTQSDSISGSMLQHIIRTPKKSDEVNKEDNLSSGNAEIAETNCKLPTKQTANAFEVMMNARNKTIGSNTPGKDPIVTDESAAAGNSEKSNAKDKRKLMLQSWADQKGGLKRKLDEEMRDSYIEDQLQKRAKRFKKMLTNEGNHQKKSTPKSKRLGRPATRSLKLVSTESTESFVDSQSKIDPETESFLSKLSSPTKKRDSLLGYFSKVISPKNADAKHRKQEAVESRRKNQSESENRKRNSRRSTKKAEEVMVTENVTANSCSPLTPRARPRRSCAGNAKYDYDLEVSPKKGQSTPMSRKGKSDLSVNEERTKTTSKQSKNECTEINIIDLDETTSPSDSDGMRKKLAPLFMRNVPKPSPDPHTLKARLEFLRSGVPEKLRIEQERLKQVEQNYEDSIEIYPKLSHLHQWNPTELQLNTDIVSSLLSYALRAEDEDSKSVSSKKKKSFVPLIDECITDEFRIVQKNGKIQPLQHLPIIGNKHQIVKTWKADFERFPTYKCYNQLRAKYRFFSALDSGQDTTQVSESFVVTRSNRRSVELASATSNQTRSNEFGVDEDVQPPETAPNGELLYVEKYKPMLFEQVLVNLTPVTQLREFLANWANGSVGSSVKNSQNFADDSMDFLNDSNSSQQTTCNSVVLLGPTASGKTNAVFTLANELNFNVLEINAGMKRTGKKLIQELQEATQSHQIRKDSNGRAGMVKSKAQKGLLRLALNDLKGKKTSNQSTDSMDVSNDLAARKCLILIEDADIVFEQSDAGFTDAIYTLAASSKRPVIVVATDPNCTHLQRLMNQNTIKFSAPNPLSISKYLAVLSLMENCPISLDDLISLFLFNRQDLRKTLNEVQFFIQSGGDLKTQKLTAAELISWRSVEQKTPPKKNRKVTNFGAKSPVGVDVETSATGKYFASPSKRRFSEDTQSLLGAENDEKLKREIHPKQQQQQRKKNNEECNNDDVYIHQTLFEFYTVDQNKKSRIPFPLNVDLFRLNLPDIFKGSKNLNQIFTRCNSEVADLSKETKKKTNRSPKKTWLSTATAVDGAANANAGSKDQFSRKRIDYLSNFYENVSIASLLATRADCANYTKNGSQQEQHDCLKPLISDQIAHYMLEQAIHINLESEPCPYNLFDAPKKRHTLYDLLGAPLSTNGKRARSMDVEPLLREICRSEKQRAAQERRSTRFYHYLRNSCVDVCNFSQKPFDSVCNILENKD